MQTSKKVLITGGSGMIGRQLTTQLLARGYDVSHLGRSEGRAGVKYFLWDPKRKQIDREALTDVDVIVHLAGVGVADKRWNERHKAEILFSRADTARFLIETLRSLPQHRVRTLVSASGISFYGLGNPPNLAFKESDPPADDFMARVTVAWEREVREAERIGVRQVTLRTGVVLSKKGGALGKLAQPVRLYVGAPLGSGNQYVNWIHIEDLCNLYIKAIEDPTMTGPYNAVAPNPQTNREFTQTIAKVLRRPLWLPAVPGFVVKLIAGEVAELVLKGGRVSSEKTENSGFTFRYTDAQPALEDLLVGAQ